MSDWLGYGLLTRRSKVSTSVLRDEVRCHQSKSTRLKQLVRLLTTELAFKSRQSNGSTHNLSHGKWHSNACVRVALYSVACTHKQTTKQTRDYDTAILNNNTEVLKDAQH